METIERLNICYFLEKTIAEIYRIMAERFPEGIRLFQKLCREEEHHANIILICMGFYKTTYDPSCINPPSASELTESIELVMTTKEMLGNGKLNMLEAAEKALEIEKSIAEDYFNAIRKTTTDKDIISYLEECYQEEKGHVAQLNDFLGAHSAA